FWDLRGLSDQLLDPFFDRFAAQHNLSSQYGIPAIRSHLTPGEPRRWGAGLNPGPSVPVLSPRALWNGEGGTIPSHADAPGLRLDGGELWLINSSGQCIRTGHHFCYSLKREDSEWSITRQSPN